jgi:hypothetical protein
MTPSAEFSASNSSMLAKERIAVGEPVQEVQLVSLHRVSKSEDRPVHTIHLVKPIHHYRYQSPAISGLKPMRGKTVSGQLAYVVRVNFTIITSKRLGARESSRCNAARHMCNR